MRKIHIYETALDKNGREFHYKLFDEEVESMSPKISMARERMSQKEKFEWVKGGEKKSYIFRDGEGYEKRSTTKENLQSTLLKYGWKNAELLEEPYIKDSGVLIHISDWTDAFNQPRVERSDTLASRDAYFVYDMSSSKVITRLILNLQGEAIRAECKLRMVPEYLNIIESCLNKISQHIN